MKATNRDPSLTHTVNALAHLEVARYCRERRDQIFNSKFDTFMATGDIDPVSRDKVNAYTHMTNESIDHAVRCWQLAGRKISTLRPYLQQVRA